MIYKPGYKQKFFVWQMLVTPFVTIADGIFDIILFPTPYRSMLFEKWIVKVLDAQMAKRKRVRK